MKCMECGATMKTEKTNYRYVESGLNNVILLGIDERTCPNCATVEQVIPCVEELHGLIAHDVARQERRLRKEEIKFLRKHLGFSGTAFAEQIGVTPETVSRWENGGKEMSVGHERLLRMLVLATKPLDSYPESVQEVVKMFDLSKTGLAPPEAVIARFKLGRDHQWHGATA